MKNLILLGESRRSIGSNSEEASEGTRIIDVCEVLDDTNDSEVSRIVLRDDGLVYCVSTHGKMVWKSDLNQFREGGQWFNLTYVDPDVVCISRTGAIVTLSPSTGTADLVGIFDEGLEAASWSPDRELLLVVSHTESKHGEGLKDTVLISMNSQWEVLAEVPIHQISLPSDDSANAVSAIWRPDGSLCAISAVDASDSIRKVRIYKPDTLELHAIGRSEDGSGKLVKNLCSAGIGWAGAGCSQVLTAVQRKGKNTVQVVFFESNGLRHREFVLREPGLTTTVMGLAWNVDSDLLAVSLRDESGTHDKVQLWHRSNYHWYMKQELRYTKGSLSRIKFDEEKPWKLYAFFIGNKWCEYEVRWDPSNTLTTNAGCCAFSVDGRKLNMTPFDRAIVPPPMYFCHVEFDVPIKHVALSAEESSSYIALVLLSNGDLVLCDESCLATFGSAQNCQRKVTWCDAAKDRDTENWRMLTIVGAENNSIQFIAVVCAANNGITETVVEGSIQLDEDSAIMTIKQSFSMEDSVLRISNWSDTPEGALVELSDGALLEYEKSDGEGFIVPSLSDPFLEPCPWLVGVKHSGQDFEHMEPSRLVFGRSAKSRLYSGDLLLSDSASSFFLSTAHEFLCFVVSGSRCQIRFIPLSEIVSFDPLMGSDQNQLLLGYEPRNVERGSVVVGILPSAPTAVLQLPRGNLEAIDPRALVLRSTMKHIECGDYGKAFTIMRRQKVDLNLMVDFDPLTFLVSGVSGVLQQITSIDHLNLFISSLQDWNVTEHRYPIPSWLHKRDRHQDNPTIFDFSNKINQVCQSARSIMMRFESQQCMDNGTSVGKGHFLLPILSTFAKQNPPKLEEALLLIRENAFENYKPNSKKPALFADKAQTSIRYLAFLAEYDLLFETALGMYDYELTRAVARNSQMDPKKYLPLLKRLKSLPRSYGRYEVDVRLKRYKSALINLVDSHAADERLTTAMVDTSTQDGATLKNSFSDCMKLIEEHSLHDTALPLFRNDEEKRRVITLSLGERLLGDDKARTAMTIFSSTRPVFREGALRAARACKDWRSYFALIQQDESTEKMDDATLGVTARTIAHELTADLMAMPNSSDSRRQIFADAASILFEYAGDTTGGIEKLIDGELWSEARRVSLRFGRTEFVKKCIDAAVAHAHMTLDNISDRRERFLKANERFAEVVKIRKQAAIEEAPQEQEDETGSLFSAASTRSNMSLRSTASNLSTGSAISVSSVISVKTNTNFTMTSSEDANRHRSKFNKGKQQKKSKRKKSKKMQRGSEEELQNLATELRVTWYDMDFARSISDTILFLLESDHHAVALALFDSYVDSSAKIEASQKARIEKRKAEKAEEEAKARKEGMIFDGQYYQVEIPVEQEADAMKIPKLNDSVQDFFSLISSGGSSYL